MRRARAAAGIAGTATFVTAWAVLGARTNGYSPVHHPISRLAAVGAPTHTQMTAALIAFGAGVATYAPAVRDAYPGGAGVAMFATAAASIGIAATPLDSVLGGAPHAIAAGSAYLSLAAIPLLAPSPLSAAGQRRAAIASRLVGIATGASLAASIIDSAHTGLWQRAGLTIGDVWIVASALALANQHPGAVPSG